MTQYIAPAFGTGSEVFVGGTIILGALCGFFSGYLPTRLFMATALTESDIGNAALAERRKEQNVKEVETVQAAAPAALEEPARGVQNEGAGAEAVRAVRREIATLARQYEALRKNFRAGPERTYKMEEVVSQMRRLAPHMDAELQNELWRSNAPGDKLALVTWLQVYPRPDRLDWLAGALGSEKPFIGYHAALALLTAARDPSIDGELVQRAIRWARSLLEPSEMLSDRARLLNEAEQQVKARV